MALNAYMTVTGSKQGSIKGGSTKKGSGKGKPEEFPIIAVEMGIGATHALGLGKSTGKGHHHPVIVVREIDVASHHLTLARATHEVLENVTLHFSRGNKDKETMYMVKLIKALLVSSKRISWPGVKDPCEQLEFSYEEIETTMDHSG